MKKKFQEYWKMSKKFIKYEKWSYWKIYSEVARSEKVKSPKKWTKVFLGFPCRKQIIYFSILFDIMSKLLTYFPRKTIISFCLEDKMLSKAAIQIALTRRYPLRNNSWLFASQSTLTWVTRHGIHDDTHTSHTTIVIQKSKKTS